MPTCSLEVGAVQADLLSSTRSGSASANAPLVSKPGSETLSFASPAVEMTLAAACAVYSFATPGVNAPNAGVPESVSDSVAGTVPDTSPVTVELARNVVGVMVGLPGVLSHWVKYVSSLLRFEDSK